MNNNIRKFLGMVMILAMFSPIVMSASASELKMISNNLNIMNGFTYSGAWYSVGSNQYLLKWNGYGSKLDTNNIIPGDNKKSISISGYPTPFTQLADIKLYYWGECVSMVKALAKNSLGTNSWIRGRRVIDGNIAPGTAIASFYWNSSKGRYMYDGNGGVTAHVAFFREYIRNSNGKITGINVWDANWVKSKTVGMHIIPVSGSGKYNATNYYVVNIVSTPRSYTFQTTNNAMQITVDGIAHNSPYTIQWADGTTHSVAISSNKAIVSGKSRYLFKSWSGKTTSTSTSISITASATTYGTYTANYNTQYYLTVNTEPSSLTTIVGSGWYNSGTIKSLTAPGSVGSYTFSTWKIDSSPASGNPISVKMNAPHTATAVYTNVITPNPTLSVSPASGLQGTTFYYTGNYFTPNTVTEWHVRKPDGNEYVPYDTSVSANSLGVFNRNWASSCTSMLGTYTIWAVDKTTGKRSNDVSETVTASASCTNVQYTSHFANTGWMSNWVQNGQTAGTADGNQMEAIKIKTTNYGITYRSHVAFDGWQSWVSDGAIAGTVGQAKSLQAIEIKLQNAPSNLHVYYRVYVHGQGWQEWKYDGQTAGTTGLGLAVEAIEIKIQN